MSGVFGVCVVALLASAPADVADVVSPGAVAPSGASAVARADAAPDTTGGAASVRAADGTPMLLESGGPNPAFFLPPKGYRSPEGFQTAKWGMTESEVRKAFPKAQAVDDKGLFIRGDTAGLKTDTFFHFVDNRLVSVGVQSREVHLSASQYVADFKRIRALLLKKYGPPVTDGETWHESLLKDTPDGLHAALVLGHAELGTTWNTGETIIGLTAKGKEGRVALNIQYGSSRLMALFLQQIQASEVADL
ncbi:hypothetical protein [Myxococcus xanthus]|uniref:hypothetical protein n=1 Tax=Myxococcus xanthus TaxID=34 RepID=UPI00112C7CB2|nr:hypothetical protein [Myxococcus xanthus]